MLTIVGDVIEYDGKPFAIITAPLSGWRMDAIDAVNNFEDDNEHAAKERAEEIVDDRVKAAMQDDNLLHVDDVVDAVEKVCDELWISAPLKDALKHRMKQL